MPLAADRAGNIQILDRRRARFAALSLAALFGIERHILRRALGLIDQKRGEAIDALHKAAAERIERAFIVLARHDRQRFFPLAGQYGRGQLLGRDGDQLVALVGGENRAPLAPGVAHLHQPLDDGGARGGRAQTAVLHALAQAFVLERAAGVLHGLKERAVGVRLGGLGLLRLELASLDLARRADGQIGQRVRLILIALFRTIDRLPALFERHAAGRAEIVRAHAGGELHGQIFIVGIVRGDQPPDHHVEHAPLRLAEPPQRGKAAGGHERVMIADLRVVVHPPARGEFSGLPERRDQSGVRLGQGV